MDSVSAILTTLDAAITSAGRQYFEATAGAVGPIYTTLLALLLVMVGINAALNVYRISMRDAVQLSFRIVMAGLRMRTTALRMRRLIPPTAAAWAR